MNTKISRFKIIIAIILNFLLVILEGIGVYLSVERHSWKVFQFYTENSNYFALIVSVIFIICGIYALKKNVLIKEWVHNLRFIASLCLLITLLVVVFLLGPMFPQNFIFYMFGNSNLYQHLLCPIISLLSFIFFENEILLKKSIIFISLIPTCFYGVLCILLNLLKVMEGPYPFFYLYQMPWHIILLTLISICIGSIFVSYILYFCRCKSYSNNHLKLNKRVIVNK